MDTSDGKVKIGHRFPLGDEDEGVVGEGVHSRR